MHLCRCFAGSTIPQVRHSISRGLGINHRPLHVMPWTCQPPSLTFALSPLVPLLVLCPSSSPARFASSSAANVIRIAHFRCPTPQKRPTPIHAAHVMDITLNASGVRVRALLEIVYSFIGPFCTFLIIPFGLDPFPLPPYSLVAYMYIPSAPRPWARHRTIEL